MLDEDHLTRAAQTRAVMAGGGVRRVDEAREFQRITEETDMTTEIRTEKTETTKAVENDCRCASAGCGCSASDASCPCGSACQCRECRCDVCRCA